MNNEASRRKRQRCTASLRDILSNLGIHNRRDWFEYFDKTRPPHRSETLAKKSERKFKEHSIPLERQRRQLERSKKPESLQTVIPQRESWVARIFDQGPIEQISSLVFTIFTIAKSVVWSIIMPCIKHVFYEHGFHTFPPFIFYPYESIMDRLAPLNLSSPAHSDHSVDN
ncbi:uncharacterized protein LOC26534617 [Drosophila yakuba]|uniref:Uncharacterized protein n=1 Tax=Drosophila yakuba TaxID=7245 RepID=A0A0R1DLF0_DROYA|nr:uncharacterized protein LOC26534617 [Drosophila yakuba]KRJ98116.1 uncharacterized protein Dyak_GE27436 [Drosophila yakuba]